MFFIWFKNTLLQFSFDCCHLW